MIEIARNNAENEQVKPEFLVLDCENDLPASWKHTFDYIVFFDSLHHMQNVKQTLENCFSVLKPGGSIVLSEPNLLHGFSKKTQQIREEFQVNERGFSWWGLKRCLRQTGYHTIERYGNHFRRPLRTGRLLDVLEMLLFGLLEWAFLSHWRTTILLKARKPANSRMEQG